MHKCKNKGVHQNMSLAEIYNNLSVAHTTYWKVKKNASIRHNNFLPTLACHQSDYLGSEYKIELEKLERIHQQQTTVQCIQRMQQKVFNAPTVQVFYTNDQGERILSVDKDKIEAACIQENEQ